MPALEATRMATRLEPVHFRDTSVHNVLAECPGARASPAERRARRPKDTNIRTEMWEQNLSQLFTASRLMLW